MALIFDESRGVDCYLSAFHQFGRLAGVVNTVISQRHISKLHAVIEWQQESWQIRDLSRHGTWVNQHKLAENTRQPLSVGDRICFGGCQEATFVIKELSAPAQFTFTFELSADEEATWLEVSHGEVLTDLGVRSHHYLTLNLARYRAQNMAEGLPLGSQGWVDAQMLAKALGIDLRHLNIQVYRARHQFSAKLKGDEHLPELIERRAGKVRFSPTYFKIIKGGELETVQFGCSTVKQLSTV
ncbi:MAG: hypothetical protein ACI8WB_002155 [Phenylobacterium sp.]|jgi:hypothetical protein